MKKLFAVLAVAGVLVACNDSATKEGEVKTDSPAATSTVDSPAVTATPVDSTATQAVDSAKAAVDTTKK